MSCVKTLTISVDPKLKAPSPTLSIPLHAESFTSNSTNPLLFHSLTSPTGNSGCIEESLPAPFSEKIEKKIRNSLIVNKNKLQSLHNIKQLKTKQKQLELENNQLKQNCISKDKIIQTLYFNLNIMSQQINFLTNENNKLKKQANQFNHNDCNSIIAHLEKELDEADNKICLLKKENKYLEKEATQFKDRDLMDLKLSELDDEFILPSTSHNSVRVAVRPTLTYNGNSNTDHTSFADMSVSYTDNSAILCKLELENEEILIDNVELLSSNNKIHNTFNKYVNPSIETVEKSDIVSVIKEIFEINNISETGIKNIISYFGTSINWKLFEKKLQSVSDTKDGLKLLFCIFDDESKNYLDNTDFANLILAKKRLNKYLLDESVEPDYFECILEVKSLVLQYLKQNSEEEFKPFSDQFRNQKKGLKITWEVMLDLVSIMNK